MLVLTRKPEQAICIGDNIRIQILGIRGDQVSIGITAPKEMEIVREEILGSDKHKKKETIPPGEEILKEIADKFKK